MRYVGQTVSPADAFTPEVAPPSSTLYAAMIAYTWDDYRVALVGRNLADETCTVRCG